MSIAVIHIGFSQGGAEKSTINFCNNISLLSEETILITDNPELTFEKFKHIYISFNNNVDFAIKTFQIAESKNINHLIVIQRHAAIYFQILNIFYHKKLCVFERNHITELNSLQIHQKFKIILSIILMKLAKTQILTNSYESSLWYKKRKFKAHTINNTCNISKNPNRKKSLSNILWIGRFEEQKDPILALEVFNNLTTINGLKLTFIGDGKMKDKLLQHPIYINNKNTIEILPWSHDINWEHYDVLLMTSHYEGMPNVMLEGIAGGAIPVMAPFKSGPKETLLSQYSHLISIDRNPINIAKIINSLNLYTFDYQYLRQRLYKNTTAFGLSQTKRFYENFTRSTAQVKNWHYKNLC